MSVTRIYVLFASSFRCETSPNISHETPDGVRTYCGRLVANAATVEPDDNDLEPDCNVCRRASLRARGLQTSSRRHHTQSESDATPEAKTTREDRLSLWVAVAGSLARDKQ